MTLGPDVNISCLSCGELEKYEVVLLGKNFGAVLWVEGFLFVAMMAIDEKGH